METTNPVFITEINQRTASTGKAFLDIKTSDNKKYRAFEPGVQDAAQKAYQNHTSVVIAFDPGKPVPGKSYNYCDTAKSIFPANSEANTPQGHPFPSSVRPANASNFDDKKDTRIARHVALKAAIELAAGGKVQNLDDILPWAETFHAWLMK